MDERYICVVGAVNLDIGGRPFAPLVMLDSNPGQITVSPGGVGRNIAHNLRLLGQRVSLLTAFGEDGPAAELRESCLALGMDLGHAWTVPGGRSSIYLYLTDSQGDMVLGLSDMELTACITPEYLERQRPVLDGAALVVLDGNLPEETLLWVGDHVEAPLLADPVSAAKCRKLLPLLPRLHSFKPNAIEAAALTGETDPARAALALCRMGVRRSFVTLGAEGAVCAEGERLLRLPCPETRLRNATGGGDAFTAALAEACLMETDLEGAARLGLAAGAVAVAAPGAISPDMGLDRILEVRDAGYYRPAECL